MKFKDLFVYFLGSFILVLIVASIVSYLWNLIFYATGSVDWGNSFQLSIIFSIVLPWLKWMSVREEKRGSKKN